MTGTYAAGTDVSPSRSRDEIERVLTRYGATEFAYAISTTRSMLGFVAHNRQIRFEVPMPDPHAPEFVLSPTKRKRTDAARGTAYEVEVRRRWRALTLIIKAKLEAVASGITEFDVEFAMNMVLPNGSTVADHVVPEIAAAYESNTVGTFLAIDTGKH